MRPTTAASPTCCAPPVLIVMLLLVSPAAPNPAPPSGLFPRCTMPASRPRGVNPLPPSLRRLDRADHPAQSDSPPRLRFPDFPQTKLSTEDSANGYGESVCARRLGMQRP